MIMMIIIIMVIVVEVIIIIKVSFGLNTLHTSGLQKSDKSYINLNFQKERQIVDREDNLILVDDAKSVVVDL